MSATIAIAGNPEKAASGFFAAHLKGDYGRIGGPESLLREILPAIAARGAPALFIALQRDLQRPFVDEIIGNSRLPVAVLKWRGLTAAPLAARDLASCLRTHGISVLHTHDMRAALAAALIRPFWRGAWVAHVHGWLGETHSALYRAYEAVDARLIRLADQVVVGSHATAAEVKAAGAARVQVIPNAVPLPPPPSAARRVAARAALGITPDAVAVGSFGRLHSGKGHDLLVEAAGTLSGAGIEFVIAGEGEERDRLARAIAAQGLSRTVRLVGRTPDVGAFLEALDIVAIPSRKESLPLTALEAMAHGRAVVVSAVGDLPIVARDGIDGLVIRPGSAAELAAAIGRLANDADLRASLAASARLRIAASYSITAHVAALESLDQRLAHAR